MPAVRCLAEPHKISKLDALTAERRARESVFEHDETGLQATAERPSPFRQEHSSHLPNCAIYTDQNTVLICTAPKREVSADFSAAPNDEEIAMKTIVSAFVLCFALVASAPGAEAHTITHHHHHHYYHHHYHHHYHYVRHYSEYGAPVAPPPPPYTYYYPPMPASIFDVPPEDRLPANTLQWLMNSEGDPPFAETPRYSYYR